MLEDQDNKCKICGVDARQYVSVHRQHNHLCVDHDHATGRVRGLLCDHCNVFIALARERQDVLMTAIEYLKG